MTAGAERPAVIPGGKGRDGLATTVIRPKTKRGGIRRNITGYLFAAPALLGFIIFAVGPMLVSFFMSLTDYSVTNDTSFVGLDHYKNMFSGNDPYFYNALRVTSYYVALSVPMQIIYSFLLAILLSKEVRGVAVWRTIFYLPSIVPAVALSMIWLWILEPQFGLANELLRMIGLPTSSWLFSKETVVPTLSMMSIWTTGNMTVIFLASLKNIPRHLYEAAAIDGANAFHKFRHITIPSMTPIIFYNLVMTMIGGFQIFSQSYIMTGGGPSNASLFYVFYLYREAFQYSRLGSACAIAWVLFVIIMAVTALLFKTSDSWVYYESK